MAKRTPEPLPLYLTKTDGLHHFTYQGVVWVSSKDIAKELAISDKDILAQLEHEDTLIVGGKTCLTAFGIQTAIAIAKGADVDTSALEAKVAHVERINAQTEQTIKE